MQGSSNRSRLLRRGFGLLPVVAGALAFAPMAHAAAPVIFTPTSNAALVTDVSAADSEPAGTLSIIQLAADTYYTPATPLTLSGNIEITGPPTYQYGDKGVDSNDVQINGGTIYSIAPPTSTIIVAPGANVELKGFDLGSAGNGVGVGAVENNGGTMDMEDVGFTDSLGTNVVVNSGAKSTIVNSDLSDGGDDGIELNIGSTTTLINDTIWDNYDRGVVGQGKASLYNDLIVANDASGQGTDCYNVNSTNTWSGTFADDSTCGTSGVTVNTGISNYMNLTSDYGGPAITTQLLPGNPAIGGGNPAYCPSVDGRFYTYPESTAGAAGGAGCDAGSYQTSAPEVADNQPGAQYPTIQNPNPAPPACTVASKNESNNPAVASTETVNVTDPAGYGFGVDAVNETTTSNGTVGYPVNGTTWFNADSTLTIDPSLPSLNPYAVTATKTLGDVTPNDTNWSFYANNWLGTQTYCN